MLSSHLVVDPSTWLSDASGQQITPLVLTEGPKDPLPLSANYGANLQYHYAHGNETPAQRTKALDDSYRLHLEMGHVDVLNRPEKAEEDEGSEEEMDKSSGAAAQGEGSDGEGQSEESESQTDESEDELAAG